MKKWNKIAFIVFTVLLLWTMPVCAGAAEVIDQGECGNAMTWVLTDDGTLTISGSGAMSDFRDNYGNPPWSNYKTQITAVNIGSGVTSISGNAFDSCVTLTRVTLSEGLTSIGTYAFANCYTLTEISLPNSLTELGKSAFSSCSALDLNTLPPNITDIPDQCFSGCAISSFTIPASVTRLGDGAFSSCASLTSITIPDTVTELGEGVFENCTSLEECTLPAGLTEIPARFFVSCAFTQLPTLPETVTSIGDNAFARSRLKSAHIPDTVTHLGEGVFNGCGSLTDAPFPAGFSEIPAYFFRNCGFKSYTVPDTVTTIGEGAFQYCYQMEQLILPNSVTELKNRAAYNCGFLKRVVLPSSVTAIGEEAFGDCPQLLSIYVPPSVTSIGANAFLNTTTSQLTTEFTLCCREGSVAHTYALEQGLPVQFTRYPVFSLRTSGCLNIESPTRSQLAPYTPTIVLDNPDSPFSILPAQEDDGTIVGQLRDDIRQAVLIRLNAQRLAGRLPLVCFRESYELAMRDASYVLRFFHRLPYYKPDWLSPEAYANTALIAANYVEIGLKNKCNFTADGHLPADDAGNPAYAVNSAFDTNPDVRDRLALLDPRMAQTAVGHYDDSAPGYGLPFEKVSAGNYTYLYTGDRSLPLEDFDFIAWPNSGNFPKTSITNYCKPWSITLNPERYSEPVLEELTVTALSYEPMHRWSASGSSDTTSDKTTYYIDTVKTDLGYTIVFNPELAHIYRGAYIVRIDGLKDQNGNPVDFSYRFTMYESDGYQQQADSGFCLNGLEWERDSEGNLRILGTHEAGGTLALATYRDGILQNFVMQYVHQMDSVELTCPCPDGSSVKLFWLDHDLTPVSEAWGRDF